MSYRVILPRSVQKELNRSPDEVVTRILARLGQLETNPRPADVKKKAVVPGEFAWAITE